MHEWYHYDIGGPYVNTPQESFEDAIGWLKEWACSRSGLRSLTERNSPARNRAVNIMPRFLWSGHAGMPTSCMAKRSEVK